MRTFNTLIFDDIISGTASNWFTSSDFCDQLGSADFLLLQARTSFVSGTSPTLTVDIEHSPDGQSWTLLPPGNHINAVAISNNGSYVGDDAPTTIQALAYVRCRISLGGTSPKCRLKLFATGHSLGR